MKHVYNVAVVLYRAEILVGFAAVKAFIYFEKIPWVGNEFVDCT